jgi:hypothetical protein
LPEIFLYDLIQAHFALKFIHNLESELRMTASIDAAGSPEHCRGRYHLVQRRVLTRACSRRVVVAGPASARAGPCV